MNINIFDALHLNGIEVIEIGGHAVGGRKMQGRGATPNVLAFTAHKGKVAHIFGI